MDVCHHGQDRRQPGLLCRPGAAPVSRHRDCQEAVQKAWYVRLTASPGHLMRLRSDRDSCALQPSNTTRTATRAARSRLARDSRESRPPTKSSPTPSRNSDMTTRAALASPARPASKATPGQMSPRTTLLLRARRAFLSARLPRNDLVVQPAPTDTRSSRRMCHLHPLDPAASRQMRPGKLGRR